MAAGEYRDIWRFPMQVLVQKAQKALHISRLPLLMAMATLLITACNPTGPDLSTMWEPYERGIASWYGEDYHGSTTDRKSTRLNSSHVAISYAVFCLKKKNIQYQQIYRST